MPIIFFSDQPTTRNDRHPLAATCQEKARPMLVRTLLLGFVLIGLVGCAGDRRHHLIVSVPDQTMLVLRDGNPIAAYPISTSKFGLGDQPGSYRTPTGEFRVRKKIGDGLPLGAVIKSRRPTGEVLPVNAPGRDPIVTRILWLDGREPHNRNAFDRYIYIHGSPDELNIGRPASFGCVRMRSSDIIALYEYVGTGARVSIIESPVLPPQPE